MEQVFAPWRMDWVTREDKNEDVDGCVFCELPERRADRSNRILARSDDAYALVNRAPYTPGHLLVLPFSHDDGLGQLDAATLSGLFGLVQTSVEAIERSLQPDGFNVGMNVGKAGGASVADHLHVHVVPRWEGDTTFMPTTANSKVVAEALDETYDRLRAAFAELDGAEDHDSNAAIFVG